MLKDLIESGFGTEEDFNCAEKIMHGANRAYGLGLDYRAMKLSAGFGGGLGVESVCGALCGAVMVLSDLVVKQRGHEDPRVKALSRELFDRFGEQMGDFMCKPLKDKHRTEAHGCRDVILKAAEVLDEIVMAEGLIAEAG